MPAFAKTFWGASFLPVDVQTVCQNKVAIRFPPTPTAPLVCQLTAWLPFVILVAFSTDCQLRNYNLNWKLTTLPSLDLAAAGIFLQQFGAKVKYDVTPVTFALLTAEQWVLTLNPASTPPKAPLAPFAANLEKFLHAYGISIKVTVEDSDKTAFVAALKTAQKDVVKTFLHQQPRPSTPVARSPTRVLAAKVISLFDHPYQKMPYTRLTVDNEAGVFTLHLPALLSKNLLPPLKLGSWWKFTAAWKEKYYEVTSLTAIPVQIRRYDHAKQKRIEFHVHTKMSSLDGIGSVKEYLDYAQAWQHQAIAFTDHENVHSFAECATLQAQYPSVKIIYGCEFNYLDCKQLKVVYNPAFASTVPPQLAANEIVFFDLETTGLIPEYHHIIEFAAVIVQNGVIKARHSFFIQTSQAISAKIWTLTQIDQATYQATALPIAEAFARIKTILHARLCVAHNAAFDFAFLSVLYAKFATPFTQPIVDTLRLSHYANPTFTRHTLQILARKLKLNFSPTNLHRAGYDATLLVLVFERLIAQTALQTVADLVALNGTAALIAKAFPFHLTVLAKTQTGLKNLYKLVSIAHTTTLQHDRPLLHAKTLAKWRTDLLVGAPCYNSELFQLAFTATAPQLAAAMKHYDYLDLQPPEIYAHLVWSQKFTAAEIEWGLQRLITAAKDANLLVITSGDVHYLNPEDRIYRNVLVSNKLLGGKRHPLYNRQLKPQQTPLQHFRTTNEMKAAWHFLGNQALIEELVVTNPHRLSAQISAVVCFPQTASLPLLPAANQTLQTLAWNSLAAKFGATPDQALQARLKEELTVITRFDYATIYLIAYQLAQFSLQNNFLFSSRGSVGSSFLAYCLDITEVNPLAPYYHCLKCQFFQFANPAASPPITVGFDLPLFRCPNCQTICTMNGTSIAFSAFLGIDHTAKPDIDLNFSSWFQEQAQTFVRNYLEGYFGKQHVFRAGTISTLAERSAYNLYCNFIESEYDNNHNTLAFGMKERIIYHCTGIKRTTGQHPGGLMIIPQTQEIYDYCPFNYPSNNQSGTFLTTHFDYHVLNDKLLKIDILGHDDPTGLKILEELTQVNPQTIPFHDRKTIKLFSDITVLKIHPETVNNETTGALGLPEYGTTFVRKILQFVQVQTFADLIAVSGLSHGTNVWENNAKMLMQTHKFRLDEVIACRDDIFVRLLKHQLQPEQAFAIMQNVKYGKGLKTADLALLQTHNVPDWFIASCQKITYLFPRAHATAYALMAYRFAWFKLYYPHEFYAMYYTIRCAVFDLSTLVKGQAAVLSKYQTLQKRNRSREQTALKLNSKEKALLPIYEIALEMFARQIHVANLSLAHSQVDRFIVKSVANQRQIVPPFTAVDGLGSEVARSIIKARNRAPFTSQADFRQRTKINQALFKQLAALNVFADLPVSNQQTFAF